MEFYTTRYINELIKKQYFDFIQKYYSDIFKNPNIYTRLAEEKIAQYLGGGYVKLLNSGTTGLQFALLALGVGKGDEVILPANTYAGTAIVTKNIGASPIYADIDLDTFLLDPYDVKNKITAKTKSIIPVHLYGYQCDMKQLREVAGDIPLIEDASHAFGGSIEDKKIGTFGDIGVFSAHQSKNFGTFGNGGIFFTQKKDLFEKLECYIYPDNGSQEVLNSQRTPANIGVFDAISLFIKLGYIDNLRQSNYELFLLYKDFIERFGIISPIIPHNHTPFIRHFTVLSDKRKLLIQEKLARQFYDIDLSRSHIFSSENDFGDLKNTTIFFTKNTSFSFYYGMSLKEREAYFKQLLVFLGK